MADNIFTDEQLYLIRDLIACICSNHIECCDIDSAEEELEIINAIQRYFDYPEYVNTKHFVQDVQEGECNWNVIVDYDPDYNKEDWLWHVIVLNKQK